MNPCCNFEIHQGPGEHDHVYILKHGPYVKIGRSRSPAARVSSLATGCPPPGLEPIFLAPAECVTEAELHARFAARRVGREWFWLAGPVQDFLNEDANAGCFWDLFETGPE